MSASPTTCNERADYEWLTGEDAAPIALEIASGERPLHTLVASLRRDLSAERTRLILELVDLRRRAADKFSAADRMFFTRTGLEQATDERVARYKASRFITQRAGASPPPSLPVSPSPPPLIADFCCGIGGDLIALAEQGSVTGVDLNPCMAHLAAANARAVLPCQQHERVTVLATDVDQVDLVNVAPWHIDPDRRPRKASRTSSPEWSSPSLDVIDRLLRRQPNGAIKLAPAADVPREWVDRCELEWISRDRQCRQLVAWHGELAQVPGKRRATILVSRGAGTAAQQWSAPGMARTLTGTPNQPIPLAPRPDRYLFDVDPAISAARLTGALASECNLAALSAGPTYLTGPTAIDDAALACFEVTDVLPFQVKQLARYFRERSIGRLEIKKRGHEVDVDPEQLRRALKLRGDNPATLLITRIEGHHTAIVAKRVERSP